MSIRKELLLERVGRTTRLAVMENNRLCEYYSTRGDRGTLSGNIYVGMVRNVLSGMNAAFVDIGLNKNAYLAADDIPGIQGERRIEKLVRPGELIICQVNKEPGGTKGPRITCEISIPGRFCAILPRLKYAGVSKKIEDDETRDRLYRIANELTEETGIGIIVRTAAENESEENLRDDYFRAIGIWEKIRAAASVCPGPRLLHSDGDLVLFAVREQLDDTVTAIRTDDGSVAEELTRAVAQTAPKYADKIEHWTGDIPLFDLMRVDHQLDTALSRQIRLNNGGTLVIDETEAMTVIDVNTAKFVSGKDMENTIVRMNREAATEIARQIRLRDMGGIILIDFIDMASEEDRNSLLELLKELTAGDKNRTHVVEMTALGLVEVTRKKVRQPLSKRMTMMCRECHGEGRELKPQEIALRCERELSRRRRGGDTSRYSVYAAPSVYSAMIEDGWNNSNDTVFYPDESLKDYKILPFAAEK